MWLEPVTLAIMERFCTKCGTAKWNFGMLILIPWKEWKNFKKELSTTFENEALIIPNHFLLQGQENDIILVSLVRSNNENKIGFLSQKNRICVAISRARCGLYLFGNQAQLECKSSVWKVCWVILNLATDSWVACDLLSFLWTSDKNKSGF